MSLNASNITNGTSPAVTVFPWAAREALLYFLASFAALMLDAGLLWIGVTLMGWPAWISGALGYAAGLGLVYALSVRWVFARRAMRDARSEFLVFAALGAVGMALNSATLFVATSVGLTLVLAKALSAAIGFVANFVSRKAILFSIRVR